MLSTFNIVLWLYVDKLTVLKVAFFWNKINIYDIFVGDVIKWKVYVKNVYIDYLKNLQSTHIALWDIYSSDPEQQRLQRPRTSFGW